MVGARDRGVLVGLHIPKCAGSSVLSSISSSASPEEYYQTTSLLDNYLKGIPDIYYFSHDRLASLRYVWGHHTHSFYSYILKDRSLEYFTVLRDPFERFVSMCYFEEKRHQLLGLNYSFDIELAIFDNANYISNFIVDRFSSSISLWTGDLLDSVMEILSNFHVFTIENTNILNDFLINRGLNALGVENQTSRAGNYSFDAYRGLFDELNKVDLELYRHFVMRDSAPSAINSLSPGEGASYIKFIEEKRRLELLDYRVTNVS